MAKRTPKRNGNGSSRRTTRPTVGASTKRKTPGKKPARSAAPSLARRVTSFRAREATVTVMPISRLFQSYERRAEAWVREPAKAIELVTRARAKVDAAGKRKSGLKPVWRDLNTMTSLVEAHAHGETLPWNGVVLSAAALLYLVSPGDLVPDWTPKVGLADDAAIIGMVAETIRGDLDAFARSH